MFVCPGSDTFDGQKKLPFFEDTSTNEPKHELRCQFYPRASVAPAFNIGLAMKSAFRFVLFDDVTGPTHKVDVSILYHASVPFAKAFVALWAHPSEPDLSVTLRSARTRFHAVSLVQSHEQFRSTFIKQMQSKIL